MKILNVKDAELIVDHAQMCKNGLHPLQRYLSNVFDELLLTRNFIFNSRLLCIAETSDDSIEKVLSVILPPPNRKDAGVAMVAFYEDKEFIKEAIKKVGLLTEDDSFSKIKLQFETHSLSQQTKNFLYAVGFSEEMSLASKYLNITVMSYFFH